MVEGPMCIFFILYNTPIIVSFLTLISGLETLQVSVRDECRGKI
jgi:hypothetical protein